MTNALNTLCDCIKASPTPWHAAEYAQQRLRESGFSPLAMRENWRLENGGRYYVRPFGTTLYAFVCGEEEPLRTPRLAGAHLDFPAIRLKPDPGIVRRGALQLMTEVYGGPILNTWFDRPLSLAGKIAWQGSGGTTESRLIDLKRPVATIPNLAVHMNRGVNENGAPVDKQKDLQPVIGLTEEKDGKAFASLLCAEAGIPEGSLLDWDLSLYNPAEPCLTGWKGEFLSAPRLDDLSSVSALLDGLTAAEGKSGLAMLCLFDNEEIGSRTKQGADSDLPKLILQKIWKAFGKDGVECMSDLTAGMILSADVAHAWHPNYPNVYDEKNSPLLGKGFVLKTAGNQSYVWDCGALAEAENLCITNHIPYQRFAKHSNQQGGGTIGSIISAHLPMPAVDLGAGLLAMHSCTEFMAAADQQSLADFAGAFYNSDRTAAGV